MQRSSGTGRGVAAGLGAAATVGACVVAAVVALVGLGWWSVFGREAHATHRYARQVAAVELGRSYVLAGQDSGGTYFAAGNGPYASRWYQTTAPVPDALTDGSAALQHAGYAVTVDRQWAEAQQAYAGAQERAHPVTLLRAARGRDTMEAYVGDGEVYDLPFGLARATPGRTNVLLVVVDEGRTR